MLTSTPQFGIGVVRSSTHVFFGATDTDRAVIHRYFIWAMHWPGGGWRAYARNNKEKTTTLLVEFARTKDEVIDAMIDFIMVNGGIGKVPIGSDAPARRRA